MTPGQARHATPKELLLEIKIKLDNHEKSHLELRQEVRDLTKERKEDVTKMSGELRNIRETLDNKIRVLENESNQRKGARSLWPLIVSVVSFISLLLSAFRFK